MKTGRDASYPLTILLFKIKINCASKNLWTEKLCGLI